MTRSASTSPAAPPAMPGAPGMSPPPVIVPASAPLSLLPDPIALRGAPPPAPGAPAAAAPRWRFELLRLLLAVPVVALGAGLALLAVGERDARSGAARRARLAEGLRAELFEAQLAVASVRGTLDDHLAAAGRGALPDPPPAPLVARHLVAPHLWRAVLPSGALEVLDPTLLRRLAGFHGRLDAFGGELRATAALADEPAAAGDARRRAALAVRLGALRDSAAALEATADTLVRDLGRGGPPDAPAGGR